MTILDDKESSANLKIIVAAVSIITVATFGGMAFLNNQSTTHQQTKTEQPANLEESKPL